ncbi:MULTISPECIES: hypothetical protein [Haloferax]|uniref:Small CPxCG-related zinc finger protein n=1 Tax=Haloferax marinum TaxID=2666143 RepID=A0A6A8G3I5_9EURY|nr:MULTISPECIES: hypothetical protein [Haloferax]KAB1195988.1 hypothetical protein Hfx1150_00030 [Haloferax sp. CBA1150]MRW94963.1 hypothetical protein [Haloferax marinum]
MSESVTECAYCGCDVHRHDPVFVEEVDGGERVSAGAFCNYACLSSYIDAEGLTIGATCEVPSE